MLLEETRVAKILHLRIAEGFCDAVVGWDTCSWEVHDRVGDDDVVLNVEPLDLREGPRGSVVVGNELGDDGERLGSVDGVARARPVEGLVTHSEGVEVATVGIAEGAALGSCACELPSDVAWVRCELGVYVVGFPEVHFVTASTKRAIEVHRSVEEVRPTTALRITVAGTESGASLVKRRETTIRRHLREVQGTVEGTWNVRHVDVKGELLVQNMEVLILCSVIEEVYTRATVTEDQVERIAASSDSICAIVIGSVYGAVGSAGSCVRAEGLVETGGVASLTASSVHPTVVGIEDNSSILCRTSS